MVFNYPMLPGAQARSISIEEAEGLVELRCRAHGADRESPVFVLVLAHGFGARTDEAGRFELKGVPFARLELSAWTVGGSSARQVVELNRAEVSARIELGEER